MANSQHKDTACLIET